MLTCAHWYVCQCLAGMRQAADVDCTQHVATHVSIAALDNAGPHQPVQTCCLMLYAVHIRDFPLSADCPACGASPTSHASNIVLSNGQTLGTMLLQVAGATTGQLGTCSQ